MVRAVVFDLDGTLVDSNEAHAISWLKTYNLFGYYGVTLDDVRRCLGIRGDLMAEKLLGSEAVKRYSEMRVVKDRIFLKLLRDGVVRAYPDAYDVLPVLRGRGLKLCVASATSLPLLIITLEYFNIIDYFDTLVAGEEVSRSKPEPDLYLEALRRVGVSPSESVVVGDSIFDIIPAKAIKATSVLIRRSNQRNITLDDTLNNIKPDYVVTNLSELLSIIS